MISIESMKSDDASFIAIVNGIANHIIQQLHPTDVFMIRTDHWFDHKWLRFSGKVLGAVGVRKKRLTIPPLVPSRVLSQDAYSFQAEAGAYRQNDVAPLHRVQPSANNLTRFVDRITKSGIFVWFSGDTQKNTSGSIMIYTVMGDLQSSWYSSFQRSKGWQLYKVRGLSRAELTSMLENRR